MVVIIIPIIVLKIVLRLQEIKDIPGYGQIGHTTHKNDRSHWIIIYWNLVYYYYKMV